MQNVEKQRGKAIQKVEPEPESEPLPAESEHLVVRKDREEEKEQKEEEEDTSSKIKTRSRFSAAFRSLSKPKAKKEKEQEAKSEEEAPTQLEDVDSTDSGAAGKTLKKKSLTRRLLLGGLKKTPKVRPHSLATSDEISVLDASLERVETAQDEDPDPDTSAPSASSSGTLLHITISGKKVEPAKAKSRSKTRAKSSASETDYLTPTAEASTGKATAGGKKKATTTTTVTTKDTSSTRTTKLIVAKKKQQSTPKPAEAKAATAAAAAAAAAAATERLATAAEAGGKIAITESTRDTPPRERAPAKPSRVQVQSTSSTGAVRKSSSSKKLELLQQQQQRGHRLSRQVATNATTVATPESNQVPALEAPPSPEPEPPTCPPPPLPVVNEQSAEDAVSSAESAQAVNPSPVVRFAVGSAVRSPLSAYEAAVAALANQPPSSSEEPSDSSLRRLSFAQQQLVLSDHDSIEGRRETLHYHSVASEYSNEDSVSSESEEQSVKDPATANPMPAFGDLTMDQEMEPAIMTSTSEKREHLYKILVIGELGTGKTSFIKRYVHQFFSQNYRATIGVDFALKVLQWDGNTIVRLQLWDIAGQERFGNMTRVYYKEAVGAFIVFDVTRSGTFDCVSKWKEDLDSKVQLPDGSPIPCILLANKCDQEKQGIITNPEKMDEYVRENGFAGWFETSAKENINIDEASRALVNKILINDKLITGDLADGEKFNLNSTSDATGTETKNKCSC
ncbi:ras and EF-hand domain-containing protein homolog isoform X1 [Drosophila miranda]|uniref:ras and EF-hand domain-containing protein homolog isoform X1 n=2 Tax=Drosophila miranda TaxID=7229 RepID=UPI0007E7FBD6|nr:ras and EF-hand domain-containing protein homolog isoform X1 [Drosophila miranda]